MLLSKGCDSVSREQINEFEFIESVIEAKKQIPKDVAVAWLEAQKKGCLPGWAIKQVKVDMMEKAVI
jgi:nickel-dependent lactate racemase